MRTKTTRGLLQTAAVAGLPGQETRSCLITWRRPALSSRARMAVATRILFLGIGYVREGTMMSAFDDDAEETISAGSGVSRRRRAFCTWRALSAQPDRCGS